MSLSFIAYGTPVAQPRPRATMRGRHAGVYNPSTANAWKNAVSFALKRSSWDRKPLDGPVIVGIWCIMPRPASHYRANGELKAKAPMYPTGRPDVDNLAKAILDALTTSGLWPDDSRVAQLQILKSYVNKRDELPHAKIEVGVAQQSMENK